MDKIDAGIEVNGFSKIGFKDKNYTIHFSADNLDSRNYKIEFSVCKAQNIDHEIDSINDNIDSWKSIRVIFGQ